MEELADHPAKSWGGGASSFHGVDGLLRDPGRTESGPKGMG